MSTPEQIARKPALAYLRAFEIITDKFSLYTDIETKSSLVKLRLATNFLNEVSWREIEGSEASVIALRTKLRSYMSVAEFADFVKEHGLEGAIDVMDASLALILLRKKVDVSALFDDLPPPPAPVSPDFHTTS